MRIEDDIDDLLFNKSSDEGFDMTSSPAANAGNPLGNRGNDGSLVYEITSLFENEDVSEVNIDPQQKKEVLECLEHYQDEDLGSLSTDNALNSFEDYFN